MDTTLKLILSKTIGHTAQWQRLHLNAAWLRNAEATDDELDDALATRSPLVTTGA